MRFCRGISAGLVLLIGVGQISYAADLKIVLLDSKSGHPLRWKLVCVSFPVDNSANPIVVGQPRGCRRTDSLGAAEFTLPDPAPDKVDVALGTNGLIECFAPQTFPVADAMKAGVVANNTCGDASTDLTEPGEVVVFGHQKNFWEVLRSLDDEF
ncbi:MAG: hypothetical protein ABSD98_02630 [Candidatus Korobacteraceae bacterium]|jgi:hypothetical protein